MTPFHALYPPVTMYQQPEPLAWMINPSSLNEEGKILTVLKILCGLWMTVMDLMLYLISERPSMATWREASEQLHISLRPLTTAMVIDEVDAEMEATKNIFRMSSKDVTPELLLSFDLDTSLTKPLQETTPLLHHILLSAMQTVRAAKEKKHQHVEAYCTMIKSQIANIHSQNNLAFQVIHGLCLFSGGSSHKTIDLLS
ncbi:hypothetical protein BD769DRAFT_1665673 [Suillus cothurnatus]|nr:hypothetical protein BD769DRAFT_1665673 [Suillus cothurnatus]